MSHRYDTRISRKSPDKISHSYQHRTQSSFPSLNTLNHHRSYHRSKHNRDNLHDQARFLPLPEDKPKNLNTKQSKNWAHSRLIWLALATHLHQVRHLMIADLSKYHFLTDENQLV
ncbi:unnamed protein product [Didymodactylos carnosus]|uniref:Uncharacterized protein n=1 Tax=Didymodactylos carnosus TaxID=1234261 RepID=A0A815D4G7_9BILA|nr:unnamed protein product [Didymodactylos carnosus]CAF1291395.1 unnamed protein product [Didymodactylos carnosus]CAF3720765.1 unnamed protein product [Didymodactylos carnosus]CAF4097586.1 unnamed protein product [Didymodactylos carnosus]